MSDFAPDLHTALRLMRQWHPDLPLVLIGHSTGGLLAALWSLRFGDELAGLWLTSPWLELQVGALKRRAYHRYFSLLSTLDDHHQFKGGDDHVYALSLRGWDRDVAPLPPELERFAHDPAISGFDLMPEWKRTDGNPILAGWLHAVTSGHTELAKAAAIDTPVLLHAAKRSFVGREDRWYREAMDADAVLTVDVLVATGANLSREVDIRRYDMRHDPLLSLPPARQQVWGDVHEWLERIIPQAHADFPLASRYAICP